LAKERAWGSTLFNESCAIIADPFALIQCRAALYFKFVFRFTRKIEKKLGK
jgi:hypothetical protein